MLWQSPPKGVTVYTDSALGRQGYSQVDMLRVRVAWNSPGVFCQRDSE